MNKKAIVAAVLAAGLSGCGGGGGGGGDTGPDPGGGGPVPVQAFNMEAVVASMLAQGTSHVLRGNDGADVIEIESRYTPTTDGVFQGVTYHRTLESSTMRVNGSVVESGASTIYYTPPARIAASTYEPGVVTLVTYEGNLPTSGFVGQSGPCYRSATTITLPGAGTVPLGETVTTWSLEADGASTAWACITSTAPGDQSAWEKDCYRIDSAGSVSAIRVTLFANGRTLVLQSQP